MKKSLLTITTILLFSTLMFATSASAASFGGLPTDPNPTEGFTKASLGKTGNLSENLGLTRDSWFNHDERITDNVRYIEWSPSIAPRVRLGVNIYTTIVLPKDETIRSFLVGSPLVNVRYNKEAVYANTVIVTPLASGFDTNLTIYTDAGNIFNFVLFAESHTSKIPPLLTLYLTKAKGVQRVQWDDTAIPSRKNQDTEESKKGSGKTARKNFAVTGVYSEISKTKHDYLKDPESSEKINTQYKMNGDKNIAPFGVYDDGLFTYFDFRENLVSDRLPIAYKVVDGYDTIINTRFEKGYLIAETLSPEGWTLVNGESVVCVKPTKDLRAVHAQNQH